MGWVLLGLAAGAICLLFWLTRSIQDQILTPDLVDDPPPIIPSDPVINPPPVDETIFDDMKEEMAEEVIEEIMTETEPPDTAPTSPDPMPVAPPDPVEPDPPAEVSEDTSFDFDSGDDGGGLDD